MRVLPMMAAVLSGMAQLPPTPVVRGTPTPGTIMVELADAAADPSAADAPFVDAVRRALTEASFLALPGTGHSRYIAEVTVLRHAKGIATADPAEARPAAQAGDWSVRLRATLPSRKTDLHPFDVVELDVRIVERRDGKTVWSGSALTAQSDNPSAETQSALADKLAEAVIRRFPAPSQGPIPVP